MMDKLETRLSRTNLFMTILIKLSIVFILVLFSISMLEKKGLPVSFTVQLSGTGRNGQIGIDTDIDHSIQSYGNELEISLSHSGAVGMNHETSTIYIDHDLGSITEYRY